MLSKIIIIYKTVTLYLLCEKVVNWQLLCYLATCSAIICDCKLVTFF